MSTPDVPQRPTSAAPVRESAPGAPLDAGRDPDPIRVSAVVLRDASGRIVTVRKRGTSRFQLPGGKPEPGEDALDAAVRECAEEIGVTLDRERLVPMGVFRATAANEAGREVVGTVFAWPDADACASARAAGEIEELRLLDPASPPPAGELAHLLHDHVLPAVTALDGGVPSTDHRPHSG